MPVAPTPPTKPTPPVAPEHASPSTNTSASAPTPAPATAAASAASSAKQANSDANAFINKVEGLGKAFQGNTPQSTQIQSKDAPKNEPAAASTQSNTGQTMPMASFDSQTSTQTSAPAKITTYDKQSSGFSYLPFIGIIIITAVVLVGMRLFKNKTPQPRPSSNNFKRKAPDVPKEGLNVVATADTKTPKPKSTFEVRI